MYKPVSIIMTIIAIFLTVFAIPSCVKILTQSGSSTVNKVKLLIWYILLLIVFSGFALDLY